MTIQHPRAETPDRASSTVIGTLLMALLTVTLALTLSDFLAGTLSSETQASKPYDFGFALKPGEQQWGNGDERVELSHRGGPPLSENRTRVHVTVGNETSVYEHPDLGSAFDDGNLTVGETWTKNETVDPETTVLVAVVSSSSPSRVLSSAELRSGDEDCQVDTNPPVVDSWTKSPEDVDTSTTGAVTVTITAKDGCAGVDDNETPHVEHRFDDASFVDDGSMTHLGGNSWQGEIPEPADGWSAKANQSLVTRVTGLEDLVNNSGPSENHTDLVENVSSNSGTLTYANETWMLTGQIVDSSALGNASDDGQATNLTENETGSGPSTSEIYGTAHTSSGAQDPGNATGSPNDGHATLPSNGDSLQVSGFSTSSGNLQTVEFAFEGHETGTANGAEDELTIAYEVNGTEGSTSKAFPLSNLSDGSDGPAEYVNVTGDRDWTWTDISNTDVKATYDKQQAEDDVDFHVDALWLRVTSDDPDYNLTARVNVTDIPTGSHDLELNYNTTGETFHVDVKNTSSQAWETRGSQLTSTARTNWTISLDNDDVDNGTLELRFRDHTTDAGPQDRLSLDFARVRTR